MAYASRTGTRRNLDALRAAGWGLLVSCSGVQRDEGFARIVVDNPAWPMFCRGEVPTDDLLEAQFVPTLERFGPAADFVVAPDIVMGGADSLALTARWLPRVLASTRLALVAVQNGMTWRDVLPLVRRFGRDLVEIGGRTVRRVGVFVGGDTAWKLASLRSWGRLCRRLRCWLHVGRVNSARRIALCTAYGVDSFDGTSASRFAVTLPKLDDARQQRSFAFA